MSVQHRRFVIIGAAGGIGSALARRLERAGASLILFGRSAERLAPLAEELGAEMRSIDASDAGELENAVLDAGPIHGIVNCAGSLLLKPAHLTSETEWRPLPCKLAFYHAREV